VARLIALVCEKPATRCQSSASKVGTHTNGFETSQLSAALLTRFLVADEHVDAIVAEGAIDAVVPLLSRAKELTDNSRGSPAT
jgi:hypothetical protein